MLLLLSAGTVPPVLMSRLALVVALPIVLHGPPNVIWPIIPTAQLALPVAGALSLVMPGAQLALPAAGVLGQRTGSAQLVTID